MPIQIRSLDELKRLLDKASECRVVRLGDKVKLKLRTKKVLYIYIASNDEADAILKEIKIPKVEV